MYALKDYLVDLIKACGDDYPEFDGNLSTYHCAVCGNYAGAGSYIYAGHVVCPYCRAEALRDKHRQETVESFIDTATEDFLKAIEDFKRRIGA
jgi:hypothetical protein